jgi:hypothetical protein
LQALEEVKLREMAIIDLQKRITEGETKLKQQQNLYEAVRADRNLYSKNLIESQDEIQVRIWRCKWYTRTRTRTRVYTHTYPHGLE